ncbi:MAG: ANTAR domain-containing protein [Reinekea sp.]|nr:ANTAR domain-containing protein [Reinekea sp.]
MNILIIDQIAKRAEPLEQALRDLGHEVLVRPPGKYAIYKMVESFQPDVVIVDADSPDRDTLEDVSMTSDRLPRPIIFFANDEDDDVIRQSIQAGVSAYIVDGLQPSRVKTLLNVAISRLQEQQSLKAELKKTSYELSDRKIIDKAKGLLMKHKQCDEDAAFSAMRKMAMNKNVRLSEIAQDVIDLFG